MGGGILGGGGGGENLKKLISRGAGIRMSWVENFQKINKQGDVY